MRTTRTLTLLAAGALLSGGLTATSAYADVVPSDYQNGGFEDPVVTELNETGPGYKTFAAGETVGANGWEVVSGDVDVVYTPDYPVHSGTQALDLNGLSTGSIRQSFTTVPGHAYSVLYWVNTNGGEDWNIHIAIDGAGPVFGDGNYDGTSKPGTSGLEYGIVEADGLWERWGPSGLVAGGTSMIVTLTSLESGFGGVILDDIAVVASNAAPVADDAAVAVDEDTALPMLLHGTDADGDDLSFTVPATTTQGGTLTHDPLDPANDYTYLPAANFNGTDSFTYTVTDELGESDTATVTITVNAVRDPSVLTNTSPSQGIYTNKKSTVVMHALLTSTDPACVAGREVTFTVSGGSLTTPLVVSDLVTADGKASGKFTLGVGTYTVGSVVTETTACGASFDSDPYVFQLPKK